MLSVLRNLARNKQFKEGGVIKQEDYILPFQQNMNMLTAMFELRKWFIFNSPHKHYCEKYTNEMTHLHNELNYLFARTFLRRGLAVFGIVYGFFWFFDSPDAIDWKDSFDLKFEGKTYGNLVGAAGEGGSSIDD